MAEHQKKVVLLDVHAILHRAYHALPDFATSQGEPTGGLYGLSTMLLKIIGDLKPDYLFACYDLPKPTYRHEAYKDYKAGRAKADDELVSQMKRSREIFQALNIPIYDLEGFEADDMIGTIVEKLKMEPDVEVVIASGDMDTLQLVTGKKVRVYTLKKGIKDTIIYDEDGVRERYGFGPELLVDYKGLRGDPSDNIIGVPGIGEKTATDLIVKFGPVENIFKQIKEDKTILVKAGIKERIVNLLIENEDEAQFSKMLGTIRRDAPIVFSLPEKNWLAGLELETIGGLWTALEFRTLLPRLKEILLKYKGGHDDKSFEKNENGRAEATVKTAETEEDMNKKFVVGVGETEIKETLLQLWLVNSTMTDPQISDLAQYGNGKSFGEVRGLLAQELEKKGLQKVFNEIEKPLIPVVEKMEKRGVVLDKDALALLSVEHHQTLAGLEQKIQDLAGVEFNVSSPKQVGEILFDKLGLKAKNQKKTGGGALSTKESELEKMRDLHPIIDLILEYRELNKLLTTYIDNLPNLVAPDGRLHARFLQAGTTTGRMSSQDPNLQNIPNKTDLGREIRKSFKAEAGFELLSLDYSQIELRIAAFLSGDEKLLQIFKEGKDIHTSVASLVFGVAPEAVDKEMRRRAKVINFGIIYGMGVNALKANLGTERAEAQKFYDDYFNKFSGLADYLDQVKNFALSHGYTETLFGRRRYFEGLKSKLPFIRAAAERMAINAPIQGTEADIVKLAMIKIDDYLVQEGLTDEVRLILQVHDELVYEVKKELVEKVAPKIKEIMENLVDKKASKGVVCVAEAARGENWGKLEKIKID